MTTVTSYNRRSLMVVSSEHVSIGNDDVTVVETNTLNYNVTKQHLVSYECLSFIYVRLSGLQNATFINKHNFIVKN